MSGLIMTCLILEEVTNVGMSMSEMDCEHVRTCRNSESKLLVRKQTTFVSERPETLYGILAERRKSELLIYGFDY